LAKWAVIGTCGRISTTTWDAASTLPVNETHNVRELLFRP
jgi:hypothetical protein